MLLHPGDPFDYNGRHLAYPDVRLIYWAGGNPFHHHQDLNRFLVAWRRPETIIIHDPFWTSSAKRADVVLPTTTALERSDLGGSPTDDFIFAMSPVIDVHRGAMSDYDIFSALAHRLGQVKRSRRAAQPTNGCAICMASSTSATRTTPTTRVLFAPGTSNIRAGTTAMEVGCCSRIFGTIRKPTPWARLRAHRVVLGDDRRIRLRRLPWASDVVRTLRMARRLGPLPAAPHLEPAGNQAAFTTRPRRHQHVLQGGGAGADQDPPCGRRGERDQARRCGAGVQRSGLMLRRGGGFGRRSARVVQLSTGAWFDPLDPTQPGFVCLHGNPNVLTRDAGTSKLAQGPIAHTCMVDLQRAADAPAAKAFDLPDLVPPP